MAIPKTIIDTYIRNFDGTDPADTGNVDRRIQLLDLLQQMYNFIHYYKEWTWTYAEGGVSFGPGGLSASVPEDFLELGRSGAIYDAGLRTKYVELNQQQLYRVRYEAQQTSMLVFAIVGSDIQLPFAATDVLQLSIVYRVVPETLQDGLLDVDDEPLEDMLLPEKYVRTVLLPALIRQGQKSKSDPRPDWGAELRDGLSQMAALENPRKSGVDRMPHAVRNAW